MKKTLASIIVGFSCSAQALDIGDYLNQVRSKHSGIKATQETKEVAILKKSSGDLSLAPVLILKGGVLSDKKQPNSLGATETVVNQYSLGVAKKFSTGTALSVTASSAGMENLNIANPAFSSYGKYAQGAIAIGLQQSLWKDFFGRATRLRWQREESVSSLEWSLADLKERQLLIDAELAFWDQIYTEEELRIRQASLQRSKKIESWIQRRVGDGIGDRGDALSAEALVNSRQLQLAMSEDEFIAGQKKIRDILELDPAAKVELQGRLSEPRGLDKMLSGDGSKILRLDAWLAHLEAKVKTAVADEVNDGLKSDLSLQASYSTNSYEANGGVSDGAANWTKTDKPTTQVGIAWTYLFDVDAKSDSALVARKEAVAAQLSRHHKLSEGQTAWQELGRRYQELSRKIELARNIAKVQIERAKVESDKLSKGRTVTSNVINSEQDAAEAELVLIKLFVERRKLEAQAQMFVRIQGEVL